MRASEPDRLLVLTDGVYAIAVTLLVLDISIGADLSPTEFLAALHAVLPKVGAYALSFLVIAALWRANRRIFLHVVRVDDVTIQVALLWLILVPLKISLGRRSGHLERRLFPPP
ncbi:TMEM175 family protein [Nonomuraea sp. NPDC050536]|uniref:TMEM175 family protein n=1 Tax=Nonomuraea sp. NPDC050536 TaxID=3364366 RepID=UPI0037C80451